MATFKLVGDNIDTNISPQDVRVDHQTRSLHYFHAYAVKDRIDVSGLEDFPVLPNKNEILLDRILPPEEDCKSLYTNMCHLVARILKSYMPFFAKFGCGLEKHLRHHRTFQAIRSGKLCFCFLHIIIFKHIYGCH